MVHTGLFASDGNPLELWRALAGLCSESADFASRLEIRLAGKVDPEIVDSIVEAGLGAQLVLLGYLPHPESVAELRQADVILLPLRHGPEYSKVYPGKIFECVAAVAFPSATGKGQVRASEKEARYLHSPSAETPARATAPPVILGIGPEDSAAAELLRDTGTGVMFNWDADPSEFIRTAAGSSFPVADGKPSAVADFSRRVLASKMATLLESLSEQARLI